MDQRQFIITEDHRANFAGGSRYRVSKAGDSEWTAVTQNKILYVYSGIDESTPKYVVPVEADANANYAFPVKDAGGKTVAIIKHGMLQSMLRSTWQITDPNGTSIAEIMTGTITALLGRLLFLYLTTIRHIITSRLFASIKNTGQFLVRIALRSCLAIIFRQHLIKQSG